MVVVFTDLVTGTFKFAADASDIFRKFDLNARVDPRAAILGAEHEVK